MGNKQGKPRKRRSKSTDDGRNDVASMHSPTGSSKRSIFTKAAPNSQPLPNAIPPPSILDRVPIYSHPPSAPTQNSVNDINSFHDKETDELTRCTHFSRSEIESIRNNTYTLLGSTRNDSELIISKEDFMKFLGVSPQSIFPNRLFAVFAASRKDQLSFSDLVKGLSVLCQKATRDEKIRVSFQLLDPTGVGYITKDTTKALLKSCLTECRDLDFSLSDDQVNKIVESTFSDADLDNNETIDFAEYQLLDERHPGLFEFLTVDTSGFLHILDKQKTSSAMDMT